MHACCHDRRAIHRSHKKSPSPRACELFSCFFGQVETCVVKGFVDAQLAMENGSPSALCSGTARCTTTRRSASCRTGVKPRTSVGMRCSGSCSAPAKIVRLNKFLKWFATVNGLQCAAVVGCFFFFAIKVMLALSQGSAGSPGISLNVAHLANLSRSWKNTSRGRRLAQRGRRQGIPKTSNRV